MSTLALKLVLTPLLIGAASLAGRRWGPAVSGWLVGLPLTSGPVAFFLALNHGSAFAAAAATGILVGTISQAAFCLAYSWLAFRWSWLPTVLLSCLVFAVATAALDHLTLPLPALFPTVIMVLALALYVTPGGAAAVSGGSAPLPQWDIPARMVIATGFVLILTGIAPALGPRLTGLLAPFPLYASILTVFAHRLQGPAPAAGVLRGLLLGLFAFASFFLLLAALLQRIGIGSAFAAAVAVALVLQVVSFRVLRRVSA